MSIATRRRTTPRSSVTRARLIAVAERLFAERGVDGITLAEIGAQAGQRNATVCQYHFGSKEGLLQAVIDKHAPGIDARRAELLDELEREGHYGLRDVARALLLPDAEKMLDPDGGREFVSIMAQLVAIHTVSGQRLGASPFRLRDVDRMGRALRRAMQHLRLPEPVWKQRVMLASVLLLHGLADHSRMREAARGENPALATSLFLHTLEDSIVAVLSAPDSLAPPGKERGEPVG